MAVETERKAKSNWLRAMESEKEFKLQREIFARYGKVGGWFLLESLPLDTVEQIAEYRAKLLILHVAEEGKLDGLYAHLRKAQTITAELSAFIADILEQLAKVSPQGKKPLKFLKKGPLLDICLEAFRRLFSEQGYVDKQGNAHREYDSDAHDLLVEILKRTDYVKGKQKFKFPETKGEITRAAERATAFQLGCRSWSQFDKIIRPRSVSKKTSEKAQK